MTEAFPHSILTVTAVLSYLGHTHFFPYSTQLIIHSHSPVQRHVTYADENHR